MLANKKAVSTIILIILLLCSAVLGALVSYLWVMAGYYMEPQNMVDLVITEVDFPVNHADYFYVTVMNPTHSVSGTNITEIYFTVEENGTKYSVSNTYPEELPIMLEKGTTKTIKCNKNWGEFAGKTITVHISATNASGATYSFKTEFVKLYLDAYFNATESIEYFNLTVRNDALSKINLTIREVDFLAYSVTNMSITLPTTVPINETISFQCFYNWKGYGKQTVTVKTEEGYIFKVEKDVPSAVLLVVTNVTFNEMNSTELNVTLWNSPDSGTLVDVVNITLTDDEGNETEIGVFDPPVRIDKNETATLNCVWNWAEYRDRNITVNAYTKQGFKADPKTVKTPSPVVLKITALDFDLADTGSFLVSVQNLLCSNQEANITRFKIFYDADFTEINGTAVTPNLPYPLAINETQSFNCTFNWTAYEGLKINVTVYTSEGFNATYTYILPKVLLNVEFDSSKSTNYFSITIQNKAYTTINVTEIYVNDTWINASRTYPVLPVLVEDGQSIMIVCPLEWQSLSGSEVTIMVKTENGFDITTTLVIP
ncbi:MAG: hypothetical protein ACPLW8_03045 [Candidatus Bathyarchaeales archaeon]